MTLDEMRAFVGVAEHGSFTRAAQVAGLHTSKLSGLIKGLELELKTQLLVRSTRSLRVTRAGEEVLQRAKAVLAAVDELVAASRQASSGAEGLLRITAAGDYGLLQGFASAYPRICVSMHYETSKVDLVREDFDLALRQGPLRDSALKAQRLGELDFALFASPEYIAKKGMPAGPEDAANHDWLRLDLPSRRPVSFEWQGRDVEIDPTPRFMFNDVSGLRDGALQGLGVARLAVPVAIPWLELGRLRVVLPQARFSTTTLFAVHSGAMKNSPLVKAFVSYAQQAMSYRPSLKSNSNPYATS